jgi:hypothetical protein
MYDLPRPLGYAIGHTDLHTCHVPGSVFVWWQGVLFYHKLTVLGSASSACCYIERGFSTLVCPCPGGPAQPWGIGQ